MCLLTKFYPAKVLVDSLDFSYFMYQFLKSFETFTQCTCS